MDKSLYDQLLKREFRGDKKELITRLKPLEQALYLSDYGLINALRKAYLNPADKGNTSYFQLITGLHYLCDLRLDLFDIPKDSDFYRLIYRNQKNITNVYQLANFEGSQDTIGHLTDDYRKASNDFLRHLKDNLFIYDYLERFSFDSAEANHSYTEMHDELFSDLEQVLFDQEKAGSQKIVYARFLALPLGECSYNPSDNDDPKPPGLIEKVIEHIPTALFNHVCRCLLRNEGYNRKDKYGDVKKKLPNEYNYGFYMLKYPTRTYHYAITDTQKYCLTEYFKYNKSRQCIPDLIFLEENTGDVRKLANSYHLEIQKLLKKFKPKLFLEDIEKVIDKYKEDSYTQEEINSYHNKETEIHTLTPQTQKVLYFEENIRPYWTKKTMPGT